VTVEQCRQVESLLKTAQTLVEGAKEIAGMKTVFGRRLYALAEDIAEAREEVA